MSAEVMWLYIKLSTFLGVKFICAITCTCRNEYIPPPPPPPPKTSISTCKRPFFLTHATVHVHVYALCWCRLADHKGVGSGRLPILVSFFLFGRNAFYVLLICNEQKPVIVIGTHAMLSAGVGTL